LASTTSGKEGALLVQFIGQIIALHVLRTHRPDVPLPFRMWLYPILGA
jgi:fructoselysine transporter